MKPITLTFLGTGTSTGVPLIGCKCPTCTSMDPRDKRLRASALIQLPNKRNILIDCGPDFRTQILREGSPMLQCVLLTHSHYDHVGGIDDLRPYCADGRKFRVYCQEDVDHDLRSRNPWSFAKKLYPGVPTFDITDVRALQPFKIGPHTITPIPVMHGQLPILGYRIDNLAYITDCSRMSEEAIEALRGVDTLVVNALRPKPHPSHMSLDEALALVAKIGPRVCYLTHMSHDMPQHCRVELPPGVHLAYDGLSIEIPVE